MTYNLTCLTAAADPGVVASCANSSTEGILFAGLSIALFFIFTFALIRRGWEADASILSASFACFVLTGFLAFGGLVHIIVPLGYLALLAFTGLYMKLNR